MCNMGKMQAMHESPAKMDIPFSIWGAVPPRPPASLLSTNLHPPPLQKFLGTGLVWGINEPLTQLQMTAAKDVVYVVRFFIPPINDFRIITGYQQM